MNILPRPRNTAPIVYSFICGSTATRTIGWIGLVAALEANGHPALRVDLTDKTDLGQEFFRWEFAVAAAGAALGIHPFNQPDVQLAKDLAKQAMSEGNGKAGAKLKDEVAAADRDALRKRCRLGSAKRRRAIMSRCRLTSLPHRTIRQSFKRSALLCKSGWARRSRSVSVRAFFIRPVNYTRAVRTR